MDEIESATLPFDRGTVKSQQLSVSFNRRRYTFFLEYNATGKFFILRSEREGVVCFNTKLTDVIQFGIDPESHFLEFMILPFDISIQKLDIRVIPVVW